MRWVAALANKPEGEDSAHTPTFLEHSWGTEY